MPKAKEREEIGISFLDGKYYIIHTDYGWTMRHSENRIGKDGEEKVIDVDRYYGSLEQCCKEMIQREGGKCKSAEDVLSAMSLAQKSLEVWIVDKLKKSK